MKYDRQYILDNIEFIRDEDDFLKDRSAYLTESISDLDVVLIKVLLQNGADPDVNTQAQYETRNYGFLHELINRFHLERTLKGSVIFDIIQILLEFGADPNRSGCSNIAPIQLCGDKSKEIERMLLVYGAKPEGNPIY